MKVLHEVEVSALPKDLPHAITVDISVLETLQDQIHVKDLIVPKTVIIISGEDEVVALIAPAKAEKVEEEEAPVDLSAIEVEKKGKKESEEEVSEEK